MYARNRSLLNKIKIKPYASLPRGRGDPTEKPHSSTATSLKRWRGPWMLMPQQEWVRDVQSLPLRWAPRWDPSRCQPKRSSLPHPTNRTHLTPQRPIPQRAAPASSKRRSYYCNGSQCRRPKRSFLPLRPDPLDLCNKTANRSEQMVCNPVADVPTWALRVGLFSRRSMREEDGSRVTARAASWERCRYAGLLHLELV
jgi:hypothetical protein